MDLSTTDVAILCGGLGTRLRSVLRDRPKPMATIEGTPFLVLLAEHLAARGFRRFVFCVGYKAEMIESHFAKADSACEYLFSRELTPLGTAGALREARDKLRSELVLVLNGDSFCPVDYPAMLTFHREQQARATLAVAPMERAEEYGGVIVADEGHVVAFEEKRRSSGQRHVNAGIYLFRKGVVEALSDQVPLSLERQVFPGLVGNGLFAFKVQGPLLDIGTPERYARAQAELLALMARGGRR